MSRPIVYRVPSQYTLGDLNNILHYPANAEQTMDIIYNLYNDRQIRKEAMWEVINNPEIPPENRELAIWTMVTMKNGMPNDALDNDENEDKENINVNIPRSTTRPPTFEELLIMYDQGSNSFIRPLQNSANRIIRAIIESIIKKQDLNTTKEHVINLLRLRKSYLQQFPQYAFKINVIFCEILLHLNDTIITNLKPKYKYDPEIIEALTHWYNSIETYIDNHLSKYRLQAMTSTQPSSMPMIMSGKVNGGTKKRRNKKGNKKSCNHGKTKVNAKKEKRYVKRKDRAKSARKKQRQR